MPFSVALWNASGLDNLGDELLDMVNRIQISLRIPDASFQTYSPWVAARRASKVRPLLIDKQGKWNGFGSHTAIVVGGGALFIGPPFRHPGLQCFFLGGWPQRFSDKAKCVLNSVCCDSTNAHFMTDIQKLYVRCSMEQYSFLSVRNKFTSNYLRVCGVTQEIREVPDPAIALASPLVRARSNPKRRSIGILVAKPTFPDEFINEMRLSAIRQAPFANSLVSVLDARAADAYCVHNPLNYVMDQLRAYLKFYDISLGAIDNMYGDYGHMLNYKRAEELGSIRLSKLSNSLTALLDWMNSFDCIIASRLHHCILAVAAGIPVLAVDPYYSVDSLTSKLHQFMSSCCPTQSYIPLYSETPNEINLPGRIENAIASLDSQNHQCLLQQASVSEHYDELVSRIL